MVTPISAPPPMNSTVPVPPAVSPPVQPVGRDGSLPERGKLTIGVIASIQAVYAREEQKQLQLRGQMQPTPLQPGWGGQGR